MLLLQLLSESPLLSTSLAKRCFQPEQFLLQKLQLWLLELPLLQRLLLIEYHQEVLLVDCLPGKLFDRSQHAQNLKHVSCQLSYSESAQLPPQQDQQ